MKWASLKRYEKVLCVSALIMALAFASTYVSSHLYKVVEDKIIWCSSCPPEMNVIRSQITSYGWPLPWYRTVSYDAPASIYLYQFHLGQWLYMIVYLLVSAFILWMRLYKRKQSFEV